jgi:hypothetical protein
MALAEPHALDPGPPPRPAPLPLSPRPPRSPWYHRAVAAALLLPSLSLLLVAASLEPNVAGIGTHTQLGLTPCGFQAATGLPCATCGMTTAFALAADGRLLASWSNQPAGAVLALLTAMAAVTAGWALVRGMPLAPLGRALWRPVPVFALIVLVLGGWAFTAARAVLAG